MRSFGPFKTTTDFYDLGDYHPDLSGILSPLYEDDFVQKYIHRQFLDGSSEYVEKYQNLDYWKRLLQSAQRHYSFATNKELKILDIGSGAGNTIFPLMDLYPTSYIVASDLSIPLLQSLKKYYDLNYKKHTCFLVQLNAEDISFETDSINIIVGGALLHHLFDPRKTLEQCYKVLDSDGVAMFFEPFELGNQIIALFLQNIINLNEYKKPSLDKEIITFFKALIYDFRIRKGTSKEDELFLKMDDKWLFTRGYFEKAAKEIGFREAIIYPLHGTQNMISSQINAYLRLGIKKNLDDLTKWALDYIMDANDHFSQELRSELLIEGGIILRK